MAVSVGDIVAHFKFDTSGVNKGAQEAEAAVAGISTGTKIAGAAFAALAVIGVAVMAAVTKAAIDGALAAAKYANEIDNISHSTGIGSDQLQGYQVLLTRTGLSLSDLEMSFRTLSHKMIEAANPTSKAAKSFSDLGIVLTGSESPTQMLNIISDALTKLPDGFQKSALASDLLGSRMGTKLIPALKDGAAGISNATQAAHLMGVVMSEEAIAKSNALDTAMSDLKMSGDALSRSMGQAVTPALTTLADKATGVVNATTRMIQKFDEAHSKTGSWMAAFGSLFGMFDPNAGGRGTDKNGRGMITVPGPDPSQIAAMTQEVEANTEAQRKAEVELLTRRGLLDDIHAANNLLEIDDTGQFKNMSLLDRAQHAHNQQSFGQIILSQSLHKETLKLAAGHAQEALGLFERTKQMKAYSEEQAAFTAQLEAEEQSRVTNIGFEPRNNSAADAQLAKLMNLKDLYQGTALNMVELNHVMQTNESIGNAVLDQELQRRAMSQERIEDLQKIQTAEQKQYQVAEAHYRLAPGLIGAAENARASASDAEVTGYMISMERLEESRRQGLVVEEDYSQQRLNIERGHIAARMQIVQQYPTFWEQQLQAVVQGNAFSMSQITGQFTGAVAQWIVQGTSFKSFFISMQTTLVQAALNAGVQRLANFALAMAAEVTETVATETAKTAAVTAGAAARSTAVAAEGAMSVGVWEGVSAAFGGMMTMVSAGAAAMVNSVIGSLMAAWTVAKAVLSSIAAAMKATVFGIPVGVAITAALIAGSIMVMKASKTAGVAMAGLAAGTAALTFFADGGVTTGPTLGMVGEAGPEAIIPLDRLAEFGVGGGGPMHITIELDGRTLTESVMKYMPGQFHFRTGRA